MAGSCGFSNGFDSGFCAVAVEEPAQRGGGVPSLRRTFRRLQPVELEGLGLISIIGSGDLIALGLEGLGLARLAGAAHLDVEPGEEKLIEAALLGVPYDDSDAALGWWLALS